MADHAPRLARAAFRQLVPEAVEALAALDRAAEKGGLDPGLLELVKLRAAQVNGCAFCLQHHITAARTLKVSREKLDLLPAWRDCGAYSERERAALAWTEALTEVALGVSDDDFDDARDIFSEAELAHLSVTVATINAWNRIAAGFKFAPEPPGPRAVET